MNTTSAETLRTTTRLDSKERLVIFEQAARDYVQPTAANTAENGSHSGLTTIKC